MEKTLNETSEIGKTSIYNSPAGPTDQEVMSLSLDNVTNIIGEYVVCLFKDIEHTKKSLLEKRYDNGSLVSQSLIIKSRIQKEVLNG